MALAASASPAASVPLVAASSAVAVDALKASSPYPPLAGRLLKTTFSVVCVCLCVCVCVCVSVCVSVCVFFVLEVYCTQG